ncbi:unnamed protein product [Cyprideis torosa]|uniref:Uncharacterized protein n=1 Tax=Cyprideis torosa TaxID=163714 RepID=A0A7R8WEJ9_9CRUS|nr:unnamed protein product [Cyprideis torosa]CAG0889582.1 unnamed protein product [Cyprideis torosa]
MAPHQFHSTTRRQGEYHQHQASRRDYIPWRTDSTPRPVSPARRSASLNRSNYRYQDEEIVRPPPATNYDTGASPFRLGTTSPRSTLKRTLSLDRSKPSHWYRADGEWVKDGGIEERYTSSSRRYYDSMHSERRGHSLDRSDSNKNLSLPPDRTSKFDEYIYSTPRPSGGMSYYDDPTRPHFKGPRPLFSHGSGDIPTDTPTCREEREWKEQFFHQHRDWEEGSLERRMRNAPRETPPRATPPRATTPRIVQKKKQKKLIFVFEKRSISPSYPLVLPLASNSPRAAKKDAHPIQPGYGSDWVEGQDIVRRYNYEYMDRDKYARDPDTPAREDKDGSKKNKDTPGRLIIPSTFTAPPAKEPSPPPPPPPKMIVGPVITPPRQVVPPPFFHHSEPRLRPGRTPQSRSHSSEGVTRPWEEEPRRRHPIDDIGRGIRTVETRSLKSRVDEFDAAPKATSSPVTEDETRSVYNLMRSMVDSQEQPKDWSSKSMHPRITMSSRFDENVHDTGYYPRSRSPPVDRRWDERTYTTEWSKPGPSRFEDLRPIIDHRPVREPTPPIDRKFPTNLTQTPTGSQRPPRDVEDLMRSVTNTREYQSTPRPVNQTNLSANPPPKTVKLEDIDRAVVPVSEPNNNVDPRDGKPVYYPPGYKETVMSTLERRKQAKKLQFLLHHPYSPSLNSPRGVMSGSEQMTSSDEDRSTEVFVDDTVLPQENQSLPRKFTELCFVSEQSPVVWRRNRGFSGQCSQIHEGKDSFSVANATNRCTSSTLGGEDSAIPERTFHVRDISSIGASDNRLQGLQRKAGTGCQQDMSKILLGIPTLDTIDAPMWQSLEREKGWYKAKGKAKGKYKASEKESKGAVAVPVCLPLCCAAPLCCTLM